MSHIATSGDGEGGNNPSTVSAADAAAQASDAAKNARTAEQARIKGIVDSDEGKSRTKLANHLAFNTTMSVDDAKATLAAAPEEKAEAAPAPEAAATSHDPLAAALKAEGTAQVGAEGGGNGEEEKPSFAQRASANYAKVTGVKMRNTD